MGKTTELVRKALAELRPDATDKEVKPHIRAIAPEIPQSQVGLALRKLRGTATTGVMRKHPERGASH